MERRACAARSDASGHAAALRRSRPPRTRTAGRHRARRSAACATHPADRPRRTARRAPSRNATAPSISACISPCRRKRLAMTKQVIDQTGSVVHRRQVARAREPQVLAARRDRAPAGGLVADVGQHAGRRLGGLQPAHEPAPVAVAPVAVELRARARPEGAPAVAGVAAVVHHRGDVAGALRRGRFDARIGHAVRSVRTRPAARPGARAARPRAASRGSPCAARRPLRPARPESRGCPSAAPARSRRASRARVSSASNAVSKFAARQAGGLGDRRPAPRAA